MANINYSSANLSIFVFLAFFNVCFKELLKGYRILSFGFYNPLKTII